MKFSVGGVRLFFRRSWMPLLAVWAGVSCLLFGAALLLSEKTSTISVTPRSETSASAAPDIESRLAGLRGRVNRAEEAAANLKARLKVTDANEGATDLQQRLQEINQQVEAASAHAAETRAQYDQLRNAGANLGDSLPPAAQSSLFVALRAEYARLSRQSVDQAAVLGPRHPDALSLKAQISDVQKQIKAEIGRMLAAARVALREAELREKEMGRQVKGAETESGKLGPELVKLSELEREAKAARDAYEDVLNRRRALTQAKEAEPGLATPPATPTRMTLAVGAAALGLLSSLAFTLFRDWRRKALPIATPAERPERVGLVEFLPRLPVSDHDTDAVPDLTPWLSRLCATLSRDEAGAGGLILLVTSPNRGEGRSTMAINLATCFAEGGDRVLLIEADRPAENRRASFGLLDVLDSGEDLDGALVDQIEAGYSLLPYGGRSVGKGRSVNGLMSGLTLRATLRLARKWFDVTVIDGPPTLAAPYARILAGLADHALIVVEWDKTSADDADATIDRLGVSDPAILYNKADPTRPGLYAPERSGQMTRLADAA